MAVGSLFLGAHWHTALRPDWAMVSRMDIWRLRVVCMGYSGESLQDAASAAIAGDVVDVAERHQLASLTSGF
jgi:hypothetical protein